MGELTTLLVQAVIIVCCCMRLVSGDQLHEGRWELLLQNAGVSAMHMTLMHTNKLLIFDQKLAGSSQIVRTDPPCNNATVAASEDCEAHSIEYDIATNRVRPLHLLTDTFCSSAAFASNGTLIHTGGWNDGTRIIRYFIPCSDATCNWIESPTRLAANRWYASNQILPDDPQKVEILVCGGAPNGAFNKAGMNQTFVEALRNCGRMEITSQNPQWQMEDMPGPRVMGDMLILPTAQILIINGAKNGTAGWQFAREPALSPFLYTPTEAMGNRFRVLAPTKIPRMYHSTASVLPDGRILVARSNSNFGYRFSGVPFPTEMRVEAYIPYYLHYHYDPKRVNITAISTREIKYGSKFIVRFFLTRRPSVNIDFHAYAPPFTTHSLSMNQRMLSLAATAIVKDKDGYSVGLTAPPSAVVAPSGYYLLTIVNGGVPSKAEWIRFIS